MTIKGIVTETILFDRIMQRRIQDLSDGEGGYQSQIGEGRQPIIWQNLAKNYMKMKKIGRGGGGKL